MKKKIVGIFVSLLVVVILTVLFSVVLATKPGGIEVSGGFYRTGVTFDVNRELPHGLHNSGTAFHMFTGDFSGPAEGEIVYTVHFQGGPPGGTVGPSVTLSGRNFETITVLEFLGEPATGTITMLFSTANKKWRIVSGTGDFENIHGSGTFTPDYSNPVQPAHIYSGSVYFNP
jgi:hypothetical protein